MLKTFPSDNVIMIPARWQQALGMAAHLNQAHVLAVARDKAEAGRMIDANLNTAYGYHVTRLLKLRSGTLNNGEEALIAAGIVSRELAGVFVYYGSRRDSPVIQALPGGACPVVGYFRFKDGIASHAGGLYAERAPSHRETR